MDTEKKEDRTRAKADEPNAKFSQSHVFDRQTREDHGCHEVEKDRNEGQDDLDEDDAKYLRWKSGFTLSRSRIVKKSMQWKS